MEQIHLQKFITKFSLIVQALIRLEAMKAANKMREIGGFSPAYNEQQFDEIIDTYKLTDCEV